MRRFTLSTHAYNKIAGDVTLAQRVLAAADNPTVTYGVTNQRNVSGNRQMRHIRDGLAVVVDPAANKVITFYADVDETDVRPDQTDDAAQEYAAKREAAKADRARRDQKRNARRDHDRAFTFAQKGKKG